MSKKIDLNCDMGESFGAWQMGNDAALMDYVSSVNIACGFHAGDATVIRKTIETAMKKGVSVGAHPSFPDLQGFGRREMKLSPEEVFDIVLYQIAAVKGICESKGIKLHHVKPHGALYNQAAREPELAAAVAKAVKSLDKNLILYGLSGSHLISEAEKIGLDCGIGSFRRPNLYQRRKSNAALRTERFDSRYRTSRFAQVLQMINDQTVTATDGKKIPIKADTVCIHGDGENAVEFAKTIREKLLKNGVEISAIWHLF